MARPAKDESERLDCMMHYRCSRAQRDRIAAKAKQAGMSVSAYNLHMVLHGYVVPVDPIHAALNEAERQGNNLNQLARAANTDGKISGPVGEAIKAMRIEARNAWRSLLSTLTGPPLPE